MAQKFGLECIIATDHGGPNHSKIKLEQDYPALIKSRKTVPEVVPFQGIEFNTAGADYSSIILPHTQDEAKYLFEFESRFDKLEALRKDLTRDNETLMLEALLRPIFYC